MKNRYKEIKIQDIPKGKYTGYYWLSDRTEPEIIWNKEKEIDLNWFGKLPFVVEANFYSAELEKSIQIKNIDGKYHCAVIDLKDCKLTPQKYIGHDLDGWDYEVVEAWEDREIKVIGTDDEFMKTKVPSWVAFKGFVKLKKK